jgi:hypothetical protein
MIDENDKDVLEELEWEEEEINDCKFFGGVKRVFRFGAVEYVRERHYGGDGGRGVIGFID